MKRFGIPTCAFILVLCGAYFATDNGFVAAQAPAKAAAAENAAVVPLFNGDTKLEPETIIDTPEALITRVADRVRDRHAREGMFRVYEHWQPLYFEYRTHTIEVVDKVAKGGTTVTYNMTSLVPLKGPNLRAFFVGKGTVAQYSNNSIAKQVDPLHYTLTIDKNTNEGGRPLKIGDRIEIEFSVFLTKDAPVTGRIAYYGTPLLYVVGTPGMHPWEGKGQYKDSFPLPSLALSGGATTMHQSYSNEPKSLFQQMATNTAPINSQPFVMGRRLHHTDFGTGVHSEPENPIFKEQVGRLGQHYVGRSCIACHTNNGRALPAAVGKPMTKYAVHVGIDAKGTPHPKLGATLQSQVTSGTPEGGVTISGWTTINGTYGDGTAYTLQKPTYAFTGVVPEFYSIRLAPPLVGQGLLEALDEGDIAGLAHPKDGAGISGRIATVQDPETSQKRLGRFGWKASQARLKHQIASALNNDMGIPTSIYPKLDQGSEQTDVGTGKALSNEELENMYRYVALLAVPPRRDYADATVVKGEALFASASCVKCHTATLKTSTHHPLTELRNQTIHPYTDMLLHDMGKGLADNMGEATATGADRRTSPLWGIGLTKGVSNGEAYLHDGRARDLSEAILWHGGEAEASKEAFRTMPAADRAALIRFLQSL